jgi:uncharacterized protein YebE (UPF0316 family)
MVVSSLLACVPLPLAVFVAEMSVVTIGTLRIIFVSRGRRLLAPVLGFFEVSIWLFAIGQTMQNLSNPACFAAFAGGFTFGNFFGVLIEKRLALGTVVVRAITRTSGLVLAERLSEGGYGVTLFDGQGATGPVKMILTVVPRRELAAVTVLLRATDPAVFLSVEEIQSASQGVFPCTRGRTRLVPVPVRLSRQAA